MPSRTFNAVCADCKELRPRCAACRVTESTETRTVFLCGPCRKKYRGRLRLLPPPRPAPKD
jgi:hypothetical protein